MRMLGGLLAIEVTSDDPEWLSVREVRIKSSRRQHKGNERDFRTIIQQLASSIIQNFLWEDHTMRENDRDTGTRKKHSPSNWWEPGRRLPGKKCSGSRTLKKVHREMNRTRGTKFCTEKFTGLIRSCTSESAVEKSSRQTHLTVSPLTD